MHEEHSSIGSKVVWVTVQCTLFIYQSRTLDKSMSFKNLLDIE